jgi:inner membrane protein
VLKARKLSAGVGTLLTVLYVFLFVVIQLEDYALLVGSLGLFAVVAAVMYFSRNVNWYDNPSPSDELIS